MSIPSAKNSPDSQSLNENSRGVTDDDKKLMERYKITFEAKTVHYFFYQGYKYEKLSDAVSYAKIQEARGK